jgi:hypothetical protein
VGFPPRGARATPIFIQPSSAAFYNPQQALLRSDKRARRNFRSLIYPHNPQQLAWRQSFISPANWRISMTSRPNEAAIDEIVASCNGDIRGALRALLLVNEQLEAELQQLHAVVAYGGLEPGSNVLH